MLNKQYKILDILAGQKGINIDWTEENYGTALYIAVKKNDIEAVRILWRHGADLNMRDERTGFTPLMYAVYDEHPEMVDFLINHGANINAKVKTNSGKSEFEGMTALMLAISVRLEGFIGSKFLERSLPYRLDRFDTVTMLLENGANTKITDRRGKNIHDYVAGAGMLKNEYELEMWTKWIDPFRQLIEQYR